jgi:hypothetical protein
MAKRKPANQIKEAVTPAPEERTESASEQAEQDEIARLAHKFWVERGCPIGSPEEDWLRAEAELRSQKPQQARKASAG